MRICVFLDMNEISLIPQLSKTMHRITKDEMFDPLWTIHAYHDFLTKTGYTGLKNYNLIRIDIKLREMYFQSRELV